MEEVNLIVPIMVVLPLVSGVHVSPPSVVFRITP
jgi:hypothetical protein